MLGRRLVFAADEYYLLAGRPFPDADAYEGFPMHEDGIGMARTFELEFTRPSADDGHRRREPGFFAWVDGAPGRGLPGATTAVDGAAGDRADRSREPGRSLRPRRAAPVGVLTGELRRPRCSARCSAGLGRDDVRVVPVENRFFGGNIGVAGLLVGEDLARVLADRARGPPLPAARRLPVRRAASSTAPRPTDLPRPVEVVAHRRRRAARARLGAVP